MRTLLLSIAFGITAFLASGEARADDWELRVTTANETNAGTDGTIKVCWFREMEGRQPTCRGHSSAFDYGSVEYSRNEDDQEEFDPPGDSFERGNTDVGMIDLYPTSQTNPVLMFEMAEGPAGDNHRWKVASAVMFNHRTGQRYVFACDQWVKKGWSMSSVALCVGVLRNDREQIIGLMRGQGVNLELATEDQLDKASIEGLRTIRDQATLGAAEAAGTIAVANVIATTLRVMGFATASASGVGTIVTSAFIVKGALASGPYVEAETQRIIRDLFSHYRDRGNPPAPTPYLK